MSCLSHTRRTFHAAHQLQIGPLDPTLVIIRRSGGGNRWRPTCQGIAGAAKSRTEERLNRKGPSSFFTQTFCSACLVKCKKWARSAPFNLNRCCTSWLNPAIPNSKLQIPRQTTNHKFQDSPGTLSVSGFLFIFFCFSVFLG